MTGTALLPFVLALTTSVWACRPRSGRLARACAWAAFAAAIDICFEPLSPTTSSAACLLALALVFAHAGLLSALEAKRSQLLVASRLALDSVLGALGALVLSSLWHVRTTKQALETDASALPWMQVAEGLMVLVPVLWLGAAFVGSTVLVSTHSLSLWRPSYERQLAVRYLTSQQGGALSRVTGVSTLGVALGVWLVLVSVGILSGFETDLFDKIVGTYGHLSLARADEGPLDDAEALLAACRAEGPHTLGAYAPYITAPLAVVSDINYSGAQLMGLDAAQSEPVLHALHSLSPDGRAALAPDSQAASVVLGAELARNLSVQPGERVRLVVPTEETLTPIGPVPRSLSVRVAGVLKSEMYEADSRLVIASMPLARRLLRMAPQAVTGVHLALNRPALVSAVGTRLLEHLSPPIRAEVRATSYRDRNQTLFAALALERVVAFVVLAFVILVASFSVVNTLTMAIWQRRYEVAILKTMGATNGSILAVFLWQGALVGGTGTAIGTALGLATLTILGQHGFGIPYEVYYVDALPVHISPGDVCLCVVGSLLLLWTFALLPSQQGARLLPAEALRDG